MTTITFRFASFGENLGTRILGERVRKDLIATIESFDCVILDFEGVDVVSNSFADECIAKLIPLLGGINELKRKTTFRNINDYAKKNVLIALRRRLSVNCSE
ncbi:STAS-like domain-containing protein [Bacteroides uniformis]|uniref:STAS-like domain-containing protein n=1 Tax=Bacteroides uniformis TaxID=820 RepID=UPI00233F2443|nr:STAS-like domain-containing protein [Bacteroides uniformis]MDC1809137.1 STAS-like domain-containing protein [Bacteroides uniformis]